MAKGTKAQSNAQESEAQRSNANTSAESTSLTSTSTVPAPAGQLSTQDELTQIQEQADLTVGKEPDDNSGAEMITVKTLGSYLVHDPTTGDTVESDGQPTEVIKSQFILDQLEAGRLEEA